MHPRLVMEGRGAGDRGVEGDLDTNHLGDHPIELRKDLEPVLGDQLGVDAQEAGDHAAQRHDAIALTDAEDGGVDVGGARFQGGERIGDRASRVVVGVELDIAVDRLTHHRHQLEDLAGGGDPNRVGQSDPLRMQPVDRLVNPEQIARFGSERVLAAEADLQALCLDEANHFRARFNDLVHALAVREGAQRGRGTKQDIDPVRARLDRDPSVVHVAAHMREYLGAQWKASHRSDVGLGLRRSTGRRQLEVFDTEVIQGFCDRDFLRRREVSQRELLAFSKRRLDDLERSY